MIFFFLTGVNDAVHQTVSDLNDKNKNSVKKTEGFRSIEEVVSKKPVFRIRICNFWASRIWIRKYLYGSESSSGSFHQQAKIFDTGGKFAHL